MVVVKRCGTLEEAYLAKNELELEGIEAEVLDEATAVTAPYLLISSGIRLAVADEDGDRAREVLRLPELKEPPPPISSPRWLAWFVIAIALVSLFAFGMRQWKTPSSFPPVEKDRDGDGRKDERVEFDRTGRPLRAYQDENGDGLWDVRTSYENGLPVKTERDRDFDGAFDVVTIFRNGVIVGEVETPGGKGNPVSKQDYENGVLRERWEDPDRNGAWNTRIRYDANGRESERQDLR